MIMNKYKVLIVDDIPENIQNLGEMKIGRAHV